jgi:dienelactone hydrolase
MSHARSRAAALVLAAALSGAAQQADAVPVTFAATDGVTVHADFSSEAGARRPLILLFHQAGANRHEYDPIAPRLNDAGFDTLAVDQRAGGSAFGYKNETAEGVGDDAGYQAAYQDMEAALAWAKAQGARQIVVLGSSYSSSLVFVLAADHPGDVTAVLAFSPGEYFGSSSYVRKAAARVKVPVFVSSASARGEEAAAAEIAAALAGPHRQLKAKTAPHGASALREDANPQGAPEVWKAVLAFLREVT